jgi:hypothetical protein
LEKDTVNIRIKASLIASLLVLMLASASVPVAAAPLLYFGGPDSSKADLTNSNAARDAFVATLSTYGVENLNSVTAGPTLTLTFGATGITGTTSEFESPASGLNSFALFAVTDSNFIYDDGAKNDSITFSEPITAFGTYITQSGDGEPNNLTIRLENTVAGTSVDIQQTLGGGWPTMNVIFLGVTDTNPFDKITFIESLDSDGLLFDDLYAGHLVPEPSTWALLGLGMAGVCFLRPRRLRRRVQ